MALYAIEDLEDALGLTRGFLTPVDRSTWTKLALLAFFVGGPGMNSFQWSFGSGGGDGGGAGGPPPGEFLPPEIGPEVWLVLAGVVAGIVLLALAFTFVASVMEFAFVESLRTRTVTVRRYWNRRWRQGLRLFGFRVVLGVLVLGSVVLLAASFLLPLFDVVPMAGGLSFVFFLALLPLFFVLGVVVSLVNGFTTHFVVPIMILDDCGVLAGWRRLWPTITSHWEQYLAYAVASFFLTLLGGFLVGTIVALGAIVLLVPFGVGFGFGFALFAFGAELLGIAVLAATGVLFALAVLALAAFVQVPVQTYLRYYALLVLGDVDARLDLVPEQRATVRESTPDSATSQG